MDRIITFIFSTQAVRANMEKLNVWRSSSAKSLLVCKVQSSRLSFGVLLYFLNFLHFSLDILEGKSLCCCCECLSGDKEELKNEENWSQLSWAIDCLEPSKHPTPYVVHLNILTWLILVKFGCQEWTVKLKS